MATNSDKRSAGKSAPPGVVAAGIILLVAFMIWWGYRNFGPKPEPPETKAMQTWDEYMKKVAAYTGGDPSKLKKEDYDKIYKQTSGFGVASEVRKYAGKP